jgi:hypothetical protein
MYLCVCVCVCVCACVCVCVCVRARAMRVCVRAHSSSPHLLKALTCRNPPDRRHERTGGVSKTVKLSEGTGRRAGQARTARVAVLRAQGPSLSTCSGVTALDPPPAGIPAIHSLAILIPRLFFCTYETSASVFSLSLSLSHTHTPLLSLSLPPLPRAACVLFLAFFLWPLS